jgi:hypothetical protein
MIGGVAGVGDLLDAENAARHLVGHGDEVLRFNARAGDEALLIRAHLGDGHAGGILDAARGATRDERGSGEGEGQFR